MRFARGVERSPMRRSFLWANAASLIDPPKPKPAEKPLTAGQVQAGHMKWLSERERLTIKQVAERLGLPYRRVYSVLEGACHQNVPAIDPAAKG